MGAAKTPKAVIQLALAVATEKTAAAPESIVEHEQIRLKSQFEAIAKARSISALRSMWQTLLDGRTGEEFERIGYGAAIRKQALRVLENEEKKGTYGRTDWGMNSKRRLELAINCGDLPPRPGQVIVPPAKPEETTAPKAKRSRKKAANG